MGLQDAVGIEQARRELRRPTALRERVDAKQRRSRFRNRLIGTGAAGAVVAQLLSLSVTAKVLAAAALGLALAVSVEISLVSLAGLLFYMLVAAFLLEGGGWPFASTTDHRKGGCQTMWKRRCELDAEIAAREAIIRQQTANPQSRTLFPPPCGEG